MVTKANLQRIAAGALVLTLAVAAGRARAQAPRAGMQGNALDANPRVGYSRHNTPVPQPRFNANLYVTGQVSGLGRFRGDVPYRAENELGISVPSATLSGFLAQSVGMGEVRRGAPYAPSPYFNPSRTVVARRDYSFGENLGTASVPIESLDATTRRNLYADLNRGYEQMLGVGQDALTVPRPPAGGLQTSPPSDAQGRTLRVRPQLSRPVGYGQGSLFGLTAAEDRYRLAREISRVDQDRQDDSRTGRVDVFESIPAPEPVDLNEPIGRQQPSLGQEPEIPDAEARRRTPAGQDVFLDMMRKLKRQRQPGARPEPDEQTSEQVAATGKGVLVQSLAGKGRDAVNYYMRGGQNQLRNGQYYEAANMFRNAARQDANNPLPKVGAGLALFAAGEPGSAAEQIREALQRFPAVMEARIASANMVPQSDLKRQMQELERKMQRDELQRDPKMLLLTTFMYRNTGQHGKARAFARKLRDLTDDKLMEGYADYILTGRPPSGRVAPQPGPAAPAPQP